jgi:hypothetical protein
MAKWKRTSIDWITVEVPKTRGGLHGWQNCSTTKHTGLSTTGSKNSRSRNRKTETKDGEYISMSSGLALEMLDGMWLDFSSLEHHQYVWKIHVSRFCGLSSVLSSTFAYLTRQKSPLQTSCSWPGPGLLNRTGPLTKRCGPSWNLNKLVSSTLTLCERPCRKTLFYQSMRPDVQGEVGSFYYGFK